MLIRKHISWVRLNRGKVAKTALATVPFGIPILILMVSAKVAIKFARCKKKKATLTAYYIYLLIYCSRLKVN